LENTEALVQKATARFREGYNCAESVLLTLSEHLDEHTPLIPKIATGFGAGIGQSGSVCGALTGSVIAANLKHATGEPNREKRGVCYKFIAQLYKQFADKQGSVMCRDLIKYDLSDPTQDAKARQEGVFQKICANCVKTAVQNFLELEKQ
jgi:C_GCAxxG_C_C family probable redox protein